MKTLQQAKKEMIADLKDKFAKIDVLQAVSGIFLGDVKVLASVGYGENTTPELGIYTPATNLFAKMIVCQNSQNRLKVRFFEVGDERMEIHYGGAYVSNVYEFVKNYKK